MTRIYGHEAAIQAILGAIHGPRLHHAWLLAGPEGVGKALAAEQIAIRLLAEAAGPAPGEEGLAVSPAHPMARLVAAQTHPDFKRLQRLPKDLKLADKSPLEWPDGVERARSITVDQVRNVTASFATKPSMSSRRVVLIDAVDNLEKGGANALLKNLEEPPAGTIFLLVSHAPGRLLPTIRSRCRALRFTALDHAAMTSVLNANLPDIDPEERDALIAAADGSPGQAIGYAGLNIAEIDGLLVKLAREGDATNAVRTALASKLAAKSAQPRLHAFLRRVPAFIAEQAKPMSGDALGRTLDLWESARDLAGSAIQGSLDTVSVVYALCGQVAALAPAGKGAKA